jgi:hypothetical protein
MAKQWLVPLLVLACLVTAIMPVFYFALYRNEGSLRFPKNLRQASLVTALVSGLIVGSGLWHWFGSLGSYWRAMEALDWKSGATSVIAAARDPRTIGQVSTGLGVLSSLAYILLLLAFFLQANSELPTDADVPVSALLRRVTKLALVAWGLWVAFNLFRVCVTPYYYFQLRSVALQAGRRPPQLGIFMAKPIRTFLEQACLFMAPYIVYNSWRRPISDPPLPDPAGDA